MHRVHIVVHRIHDCNALLGRWDVPISECRVVSGKIAHTSGKSMSFGALADSASKLL
jgi:isoquinoline 1-oxidoreductase subunit beta